MHELLQPRDLPELLDRLGTVSRVVLDTEFHAEHRYLPKLYLVQLQVDGQTYLIDAQVPGLLDSLKDALLSVEWVVHGGQQDMRLMLHQFGALPDRIWDSQIAAALLSSDHFPAGFGSLVQRYLDRDLKKAEALSDWSKRPLTAQQLAYAAADVEVLAPLWDVLAEQLQQTNRLALAAAACDEAREAVMADAGPDAAWLAIAGTERLDSRQVAILQELAAWREQMARANNQPPRAVLSDGLLITLARRAPITVGALHANRRFPKRIAKQHGNALIEAIARGLRRPEWGLPQHVQRGTPAQRTARWLRVFAEALCQSLACAHTLLLPPRLIERIALTAEPSPEALADVLGWRTPLLAGPVSEALAGTLALSLRSGAPHLVRSPSPGEATA